MCGIFGVLVKEKTKYPSSFIKNILNSVAGISIARGQDSSGVVFKNPVRGEFNLLKGDIPITSLLKNEKYSEFLNQALLQYGDGHSFQAIGHARLVTNGSQLRQENNQPVVKDGIIGVHNGIVVNTESLWLENKDLEKKFDIDTEIILSLVRKKLSINSIPVAVSGTLKEIIGTASCALFFDDRDELALFTNNGSLYYVHTEDFLIFASEQFFLARVLKKNSLNLKINHLESNTGIVVHGSNLGKSAFGINANQDDNYFKVPSHAYKVNITNLKGNFDKEAVIDPMEFINKQKESHLYGLLENNIDSISKLKRCTKCILPETFPFIDFDIKGECNYCKKHKASEHIENFEKLKALVKPYKRTDGSVDCIVPFSGGRDSTYALHVTKEELGLNPIAFTYDWGMVTDLARRNIARVCGKLGVENIIVSADIKWKRENIRKNILAWLKNPELGMIPLFMAGDKYFFYYCNEVKKQMNVDLNIWGINKLENTDFKIGFAGLKPDFDKKTIYSLSVLKQLKLFGYVGQNIIKSPGYMNQSVFDSLGSFASRYISPKKDYFHLFDYYDWNENKIESLIEKEYHWEKSIDTESTWRIGDGTASFYNYVYYTVAGFTENDTFRSNQIREGMMTRDGALQKINKENEVRYETLRWYLEILGLNFSEVANVINKIPKLYPLQ